MPCNYKDYPANWFTEIRPRILKRANDKCEFCGVVNYSVVARYNDFVSVLYDSPYHHPFGLSDYMAARELKDHYNDWCDQEPKAVIIILTIAHLDHDISHNEDENLKALCQKCHNNYDRKNRNKNIKVRKMKNQLTIIF